LDEDFWTKIPNQKVGFGWIWGLLDNNNGKRQRLGQKNEQTGDVSDRLDKRFAAGSNVWKSLHVEARISLT
jgi:hypothetical protein